MGDSFFFQVIFYFLQIYAALWMAFFLPENQNNFPDVALADADGLLAIGSNLQLQTLLKAYTKGIFPWYNEGEPICWFSPDPRFVLFPHNLKISSSMKAIVKQNTFSFSVDKDFAAVLKNCRLAKRAGNPGTWITDVIEEAYIAMFNKGFAQSAEAWKNNKLAGGLYGVQLGKVFFGESMFANESNASKFAFIKYVQFLQKRGIEIIDCQVYSSHLESLGATFISGKEFSDILQKLIV